MDQLSVTAWLPAAFFAGNVALAFAYRLNDGTSEERWRAIVRGLDTQPAGVILGTLFAVVLVTIVAQSLEFSAIRFLEGYWGVSKAAAACAALGIRWQTVRRQRLTRLGQCLDQKALRSTVDVHSLMLADQPRVAAAVHAIVLGEGASVVADADREQALAFIRDRQWFALVPPGIAHRIAAVDERSGEYPDEDRMMPTTLGLALRVVEDRLTAADESEPLRGFVIRNLTKFDSLLLNEHDQYRNRLDMYAMLCVIAAALIPIDVFILWPVATWQALLAASIVLAVLSWGSYRGAVAAARDYGTVLMSMDAAIMAWVPTRA